MDLRRDWLAERRRAVEADYDRAAAAYDDDPYPARLHGAFVDRLIGTWPLR